MADLSLAISTFEPSTMGDRTCDSGTRGHRSRLMVPLVEREQGAEAISK